MSNYQNAIKAALYGPELKKVLLNGHEFNVKPFNFRMFYPLGNKLVVKGTISHCLDGPKDDQIHYIIEVAPGQVINIEKRIDQSGTMSTLFRITHIGGSIAISVFSPSIGGALLSATEKLVEAEEWIRNNIIGDWLSVCDSLIGLIGIALADELIVINEPPPPAGFVLVRRYGMPSETDWVTVGAESTDRDMIRCGYQDRKRQFLAPVEPIPDSTVPVYRWGHPKDHDWVTIAQGSISDEQLRKWGYQDKTFSFYGYKYSALDRVEVSRWWHEKDRDWVTLADGEIPEEKLVSWGYTSKTHICYGKKLEIAY